MYRRLLLYRPLFSITFHFVWVTVSVRGEKTERDDSTEHATTHFKTRLFTVDIDPKTVTTHDNLELKLYLTGFVSVTL